jgi:hypothetical protein
MKRINIQAKKGEGAPFHYNMSTFFGSYIVDYCLLSFAPVVLFSTVARILGTTTQQQQQHSLLSQAS